MEDHSCSDVCPDLWVLAYICTLMLIALRVMFSHVVHHDSTCVRAPLGAFSCRASTQKVAGM